MKFYIITIIMLVSNLSFAHQPDISTSLLSTTDDGKHILQVISSLTAFEGEIDYLYSKDAYKTPEEFRELVIKHFEKNVLFIVNDSDTLKFANPTVFLGHETKIVVEVLNIPKEINSFYFSNGMFKDMPQNRMAVMLFSEGFPKEQILLDNDNQQTAHLELKEGKWEAITSNKASLHFKLTYFLYFFLIIGTIAAVVIYFSKKKKTSTASMQVH